MSNNAKKSGSPAPTGPFDVKTVEALVGLMTEHDLSEIYLRDGAQHLRLRRGATAPVVMPTAVPVAATMPVALSAPAAKPASSDAPSAARRTSSKSKAKPSAPTTPSPNPASPPTSSSAIASRPTRSSASSRS